MRYLQVFATKKLVQLCNVSTRKLSNSSVFDVCVVGTGPAGYAAAIRASQLGCKTANVEDRNALGGHCLNVGCIQSKSLLHNSHLYNLAKGGQLKKRGINCENVSLDLKTMMEHKEAAVHELMHGASLLFKSNKITQFHGIAKLAPNNMIEIQHHDTNAMETIFAKNIIIATGSTHTEIPGVKINEKNILSYLGALSLDSVPNRMLVIGAGSIGLELGSVWSRLGSKVTIIELLDRVGGHDIDKDVSNQLIHILNRQGIKVHLETELESLHEKQDGSIAVRFISRNGKEKDMLFDSIVVCIERRAFCDNIGIDNVGVQVDKSGRIFVDHNFETGVDGIYAIGDCIKGPMQAHKAEDDGIMCAEHIVNGTQCHMHYDHVPRVIYTYPEVAWVGKTQESLESEGRSYHTGMFPMVANSRAKTIGETDGFCKVLSDAKTGHLLGAHIINAVAGDLISEAVLAIDNNITCEQIARSCHPHPTYSEAFKEANLHASSGKTINNIN